MITASIGGSPAMPSGGGWKRFGPAHCTGDARSENTGSVSQNSPPSLSSSVEWPSRNRLASGAAARATASSGATGIGARGTVVSGFCVRTRHMSATVFRKPVGRRGATLRNLPSRNCGDERGAAGASVRENRERQAMVSTAPGTTDVFGMQSTRSSRDRRFKYTARCSLLSVVPGS